MGQTKISDYPRLKDRVKEVRAEHVSTTYVDIKRTGYVHGFFNHEVRKAKFRQPEPISEVYKGVFCEVAAELSTPSNIMFF